MMYAYPVMSRRGLCNLLFTWAQAEAYCHRNGVRMIKPNWAFDIRLGPWIRGERYKRYYGGCFNGHGQISGLRKFLILTFCREKVRSFSGMTGFFDPFLDDQAHIVQALWNMTRQRIVREVRKYLGEPFVAVHIRRGDFKQAGHLVGDEWFVKATKEALSRFSNNGRVSLIRVFTDGYAREVLFMKEAFLGLHVEIMDKASPMRDLLLMSKAVGLVGSDRSTFSMWSVFIGQMPSLWPNQSRHTLPRLYVDMANRPIFI